MTDYYVNNNPQPNGDHEVHATGCNHLPANRTHLGNVTSCHQAVVEAKKFYRQSNGCFWCSRECHTQ